MFSPAKLALLAALALAACGVGEVPDGTGNPDAGVDPALETSFMMTITPLVTECVSCHGASIAQPPNLTSFAKLEAKYKMKPGMTNPLVTKGDMSTPVGVHYGLPYFNDQEKTTVANWIQGLP